MNRIVFAVALGATIVSTQAAAQMPGGGRMMEDMNRQQAQQMADDMFARFDLNHDGIVTRQEAEQARVQMGGDPDRHGGRAEKTIARVFGDAQSLTLAQFEAQSLARFDRDDLNHDGVVTAAERQQSRAQLKAERAAQPPRQ